ncbi:MAG: SPOR domain-containing protein [Candidatus Omnitrophica bacterium]|nr:SPOR domain-containing protein [Candidatus Omnitrophota bacterium]MDE2010211.1 SPOR domain-containing protein [Candidatus Omnitrophota bacterium]MDE2215255.1 SPOR domain-containing protein [Candidatus Omnitrophota bacterium]MDE2231705.1 SPOR domain-containing protein [Candidatus Omnitrophota bacterium]
MNINYKQPQFELFPANSATLEDINKPKFLLANLTFSVESLVILSILGIMVALFSFSLGVEHGKTLAAQALDARVSAAWNVGARTLAAPVAAIPAPAAVQNPSPVNHGFIIGPGTRYTLQVATYSNEGYARQDALRLKKRGLQPFLIKSGRYWQLCTGNFRNKEAAAGFLRQLPGNLRSAQVRRF